MNTGQQRVHPNSKRLHVANNWVYIMFHNGKAPGPHLGPVTVCLIFCCFLSVHPGECLNTTLNKATIASIHKLFSYLFATPPNHSTLYYPHKKKYITKLTTVRFEICGLLGYYRASCGK
jgi:hypothetical protein